MQSGSKPSSKVADKVILPVLTGYIDKCFLKQRQDPVAPPIAPDTLPEDTEQLVELSPDLGVEELVHPVEARPQRIRRLPA